MITFITSTKDEILKFFADNPTIEIHLRELSRKTKISFPWVRKIAKELAKNKLLIEKKERGFTLVSANRDNILFKALKRTYNIYSLYSSNLVQALIEEYNHPETIILFGSYSRGEDTEQSDIDIAVITKRTTKINFAEFEKKLRRKISIKELQKEKIEKEFNITLANGIVLDGYFDMK
jgi:predicted nucleotidyltransferase